MKYLKLLLIGAFLLSLSSCVSYKSSVASGYNPNDSNNIYHMVHE
ncbi:hypothetical protein [Flammeovirga sp. SJP92]|nr:hypothetical protein [Flammeovirga sp. SJP92]